MAQAILDKQISIDELQQIIKNGYPNYYVVKAGPNLFINAGFQGKFTVHLSGKILIIYTNIPFLYRIILIATIIGFFLIVSIQKNNPTAIEIANYVKMQCENSAINSGESSKIPETCPQCKNPNSKRIRLCEWCGNQIC
jgi:hypothetical protein